MHSDVCTQLNEFMFGLPAQLAWAENFVGNYINFCVFLTAYLSTKNLLLRASKINAIIKTIYFKSMKFTATTNTNQ